jgi:hypothetical protein
MRDIIRANSGVIIFGNGTINEYHKDTTTIVI